MSSESFRQKIADLTRKSRQAVKLYSNVAKKPAKCSEEWIKEGLGDIQIDEWKKVNSDLHRELCRILEYGSQSSIVASVFELRDLFYTTWRKREADAALLQRELLASVEQGQFARVVSLGYKLAAMKAQMQALNAGYDELQSILKGYSNTNHTAVSGTVLSGARLDSNSLSKADYQILTNNKSTEQYKTQISLGINARGDSPESTDSHGHHGTMEQNNEANTPSSNSDTRSGSNRGEGVLAKIIPMKRRIA